MNNMVINKESIEKVINKHFNTLEGKVDNIKEKLVFEDNIDNIKIDVSNSNDINFPHIISNKMILDSFILPIEVLNKMKDSIELSLSMNKEIGFNLCLNQNKLINDSQQIGTKDEILTIRNCTKGKYIGKFHTHPPIGGGNSDLSFFDIANIYYDGFGCVGGTLDGLIYCYIRKGEVQTKGKEEITFYANKFEKRNYQMGA